MTDIAQHHCTRPWWMRPPVWFIGIAAVIALVVGIAIEETGQRAPMPYGAFLDQLEAGNVASTTFRGTEIDGRFKHPAAGASANGAAQQDTFRSRVPDFGDPTLMPALRKQGVAIDVASSGAWTRLLSGLPWPMVLFLGAMIVAGVVRLARGGKAQPGSAMPMHPMQGMIGLVSGFFTKQAPNPPMTDREKPGNS